MATLEDVYHRLGTIEAKLDLALKSEENHEERLSVVERWQHRAEARIAGMLAVAIFAWQGVKFLFGHLVLKT